MGLRINTNSTSLAAQRALRQNFSDSRKSLIKLSSGSRITTAADDAAGLAISEKLRASIRGYGQAKRNANDGISLLQTAEGGLSEVSDLLIRMRELAVQASSDTVGDTERGFTDLEYQNLKAEISRISAVTEFNGKKLLNGTGDKYEFQIGINNNPTEDRIIFDANYIDSTLESLGASNLYVDTKVGAQGSLEVLDNAIDKISGKRAELGARQNRLISTISSLDITGENLSIANSRIRDTDYASETSKNAKFKILEAASTAVLTQANAVGSGALKLIG